jgi:ribulose-5-phosphate 4-epimerase/fuculose-1-phosphate aldolase
MTVGFEVPSKKDSVSLEEWQTRVDLAALYRLVAAHGWDDGVATHISARLPGPDHHFLINPLGSYFEEITASSLVKIDLDGNILDDTPFGINAAGFTIHSAVHAAREDAKCVIHLHTSNGVAVAAQEDGLLPITQHAMVVHGDLAYHDYEGLAFDLSERERLVADLGDKNLMILRNHGTLTAGATCGDAWVRMFFLERACQMQIKALSGGAHLNRANQGVAEHVSEQVAGHGMGALYWPGALRWLDRRDSSYRH